MLVKISSFYTRNHYQRLFSTGYFSFERTSCQDQRGNASKSLLEVAHRSLFKEKSVPVL